MSNIPLQRPMRHGAAEDRPEAIPLISLNKSHRQPENPALDIRGYLMLGSDGQAMGRVEDLLMEVDERVIDRGLPLEHLEYAVVRYTDGAGVLQSVLVPMAVVKETNPTERKVIIRGPAREACQEAFSFRPPDELSMATEEEVYAFWEVEPRWRRMGKPVPPQANQRR
jgi:hypothetical protein